MTLVLFLLLAALVVVVVVVVVVAAAVVGLLYKPTTHKWSSFWVGPCVCVCVCVWCSLVEMNAFFIIFVG